MSELQYEIDHDDARFLDAVRYHSGEAAMHEIRGRTGLSRGKANHRFKKLEDMGLIEISYQPYQNTREKVAHITGKCRTEIEQGLLNGLEETHNRDSEDLKSEIQSLRDDLERVENKVDSLNAHLTNTEKDVEWVTEYAIDWTEEAESQILAIRNALREESNIDVVDHLD